MAGKNTNSSPGLLDVDTLISNVTEILEGANIPEDSGTSSPEAEFEPAIEPQDIRKDAFWEQTSTADLALNWNKVFPYQLVTLVRGSDGKWAKAGQKFTLPIPPQSLNITTPFAISTKVTMGGVVEEHNGAPIRIISLSGTTGVTPLKGQVQTAGQSVGLGPQIFGGTAGGLNQIQTAFGRGSNAISGDSVTLPNVQDPEEASKNSGFFYFQELRQFLEQYVAKKKNGASNIVLGFTIWKESAIYLCTPVSFSVQRSAQSPLEYNYQIQLKAWRRISALATGVVDETATNATRNATGLGPAKYAQTLAVLSASRSALAGANAAMKGVSSDIESVLFTPLRQTILLLKDTLGAALNLADLPGSIVNNLTDAILELLSVPGQFQETGNAGADAIAEKWRALARKLQKPGTGDADTGTVENNGLKERLPESDDPSNPDYQALLAAIQIGLLSIPPEVNKAILEERRKARLLLREDFEQYRDGIARLLADFSSSVNAGNATYNRTYSDAPPVAVKTIPTEDDWDVIHNLNATLQTFDTLVVNTKIELPKLNPVEYIAGLANRSGIAFTTPTSKYAVPFLYDHTLEQMAGIYLDDPNRWHEIAALNGLKSPYVDEVGFAESILTNGAGHEVTVKDGSKFFSGQVAFLSSSTERREKRRIQSVNKLNENTTVITLDGDDDLDRFTTAGNAIIEAFLPDTVNSQMQIFIPSDATSEEEDLGTKDIPGVDYFDPLLASGGIDLLLTQDGDLVVTPDGDTRLAAGMTNAVQKIRIAFATPVGSLAHHPSYGLGIPYGTSTAEVDANSLLKQAKDMFRNDPSYTDVEDISIKKSANSVQISMSIGFAGTTQFIPITIDFKK